MPDLSVLELSQSQFAILSAICFVAGVVRGFSGFALSALVVASAAIILPPVELIPICWWLEMTASLLMVRGGWKDADRSVVTGLFLGSSIGVPVGMYLTTSISAETSKMLALAVILTLALTQLAKLKLSFLNNKPGLWASGLTAGIVTGIASVGGMVVAIYVLASDAPARKIRAALVLFLFLGSLTSMITFLAYGVMDQTASYRGLALAVPTIIGVVLGKALFIPSLERFYRPFCLTILVGLAASGLVRIAT